MLSTKLPPYILQELPDITEKINYPLKTAQRVKYTCFDVSKFLIVFGATSGGIYIFNRNPCEFVQLIPNKDGAITRLEISPDEKHIAYANGRGTVTVTACSQPLNGNYSSVMSKEHQGNEVTAIVWSGNSTIFVGDDVGKISVLQLQSFIAKTMFQTSSQTIMCLDSRICQLDVKECMLLVATLTRCYICDTSQEQYRQIGQKLRDGEFGACFVTDRHVENKSTENTIPDFAEVKKYNIVDDETKFAVDANLVNTLIYCARPSSRLWEATIDGTVRRTHQYKQFLSKNPMQVFTLESYNSQNLCIEDHCTYAEEGKSVNFSKLYHVNKSIFSFKRDALYFLNIEDVEDTMWFDSYKDIVECRLYHDILYLWLSNGDLVSLKYMKIEKFLIKCFVDELYILCAELCALFSNYLISANLPNSLHILVGLREKLQGEKLENIGKVLEKFDNLKSNEATQMKSGIFVVDNSYRTQASLSDENSDFYEDDGDKAFSNLQPDAIQAFKDLSHTVSDKFSSSKRMLKEKWDGFEEIMKHRGGDEKQIQEIKPKRLSFEESSSNEFPPVLLDSDIIYKESSPNAIELDNNSSEQNKVCKSLYQYYRLSLVSKESEQSNLISIIESNTCDIIQIYNLMLQLEQFCISVGALEESKNAPNSIFLSYLNISKQKESLLNSIIKSEVLYKYFVDSCISVNIKTQKLTSIGCECGYPLPFTRTNQTPVFSELIDEFLEKQWLSLSESQCYEICKKMPCLWKKILYLRRNEDLMNVLRILLQMLDESLLHSFLPQFTLDTWDRAVQLYATLHSNMCLNCNKKFNHVSVKDMLNWDDLGALIVKSVGARYALKVMEKHAHLIDPGELTIKFYHTCMLVSMYEKYDATITNQLIDTVYNCFDFENARLEICKLLRSTSNGIAKNTALPVIVAAQSAHWGLCVLNEKKPPIDYQDMQKKNINNKNIDFNEIINNIFEINNCITDCLLCGLPLQNEVLISDGGLWVFKCGHTFHGACLELNKVKLCPSCSTIIQ